MATALEEINKEKKRKQRIKENHDYNASLNQLDINWGRVYEGMIKSDAFQSLPISEKWFYVVCRVQAQSGEGRRYLFRHGQNEGRIYNPKTDFVFPPSHMAQYGYEKRNGYKLLKALQEKGFITKKEDNSHRKKIPNVYAFIHEWANGK